jgi:putative flavoprotein involved in K+ transport
VVIATGYHAGAHRPASAGRLAPDLTQITPSGYRNPHLLPAGGVLVVGASASGIQLADELHRAGRRVVLAVGRHNRLPRRYRDRDIMWWLAHTGALDRNLDELPPDHPARREPSVQLVGGTRRLDLAVLQQSGVQLTGRLAGIDGQVVGFAGDLQATVADADARLRRLLDRLDLCADTMPVPPPPAEPVPSVLPQPAPHRLDLARAGISTVVWATGYRPSYPWLRVPVLDEHGGSATGGASPRRPVSTRSGCGSSTAATPPSSTVPGTTPAGSPTRSPHSRPDAPD